MSKLGREYKLHYAEFSQNVEFAGRAWHHSQHLDSKAKADPKVLAALNQASRFWLDYRYSSIHTAVIVLGRIFDTDTKAHNIDKLLRLTYAEIDFFSKDELKKRKIALSGEAEWIHAYIEDSHEMTQEDLKAISTQIKMAKQIWEKIQPLRNKIFAHNQILSDDEKKKIVDSVTKKDMNKIIQILLNISVALKEAEYNGRKPDFSKNYTTLADYAEKNIDSLINSLKV